MKTNMKLRVTCPLDGDVEIPAKQLTLEPVGRHSAAPRYYLFTCDQCGATYRKSASPRMVSVLGEIDKMLLARAA